MIYTIFRGYMDLELYVHVLLAKYPMNIPWISNYTYINYNTTHIISEKKKP